MGRLLGLNLDLKEQLAFYGAYHSNPLNQLIHFVFVPLILGTVAVWLAYTPPLFALDLTTYLAFLPAPLAEASRHAAPPAVRSLAPASLRCITT